VVVAGPPAAGRAAVARSLAQETGLPLVGKDGIQELLHETIGAGDRQARGLGTAALALLFDMTERLLRAGGSFVLEASFAVEAAEEWLARLPPCTVLQVQVSAPDRLALEWRAGRVPSGDGQSLPAVEHGVDDVVALVRTELQAIYAP